MYDRTISASILMKSEKETGTKCKQCYMSTQYIMTEWVSSLYEAYSVLEWDVTLVLLVALALHSTQYKSPRSAVNDRVFQHTHCTFCGHLLCCRTLLNRHTTLPARWNLHSDKWTPHTCPVFTNKKFSETGKQNNTLRLCLATFSLVTWLWMWYDT